MRTRRRAVDRVGGVTVAADEEGAKGAVAGVGCTARSLGKGGVRKGGGSLPHPRAAVVGPKRRTRQKTHRRTSLWRDAHFMSVSPANLGRLHRHRGVLQRTDNRFFQIGTLKAFQADAGRYHHITSLGKHRNGDAEGDWIAFG
jgi:hypothetical protein